MESRDRKVVASAEDCIHFRSRLQSLFHFLLCREFPILEALPNQAFLILYIVLLQCIPISLEPVPIELEVFLPLQKGDTFPSFIYQVIHSQLRALGVIQCYRHHIGVIGSQKIY